MLDLSKASLAILLAGRDAERSRPVDDPERADADLTYVTADEERRDRLAALRLALVGLLHVGV
jgi:hypothetical protein